MPESPHVAFNPLPYYLSERGFDPDSAPPLPEIYRRIKAAGFDAVHVEPPQGMSITDYGRLLADSGLSPAPGYFQAPFTEPEQGKTVEEARRVAAQHAALGLTRIFIADQFASQERLATPAVGIGADEARLGRLCENLAAACEAMVAEGVTPCLHQHIGTWVETPAETVAVLDAVDPSLLLFGPDTGHLAWAGADPAEMIRRYLNRVGAVHLKDFRSSVMSDGAGADYLALTGRHLWTEPGRGDVDFDAVLAVLAEFEGWYVVEVDIADQPTVEDTARVSAQWVRERMVGGTATS
ncbi:sugar phosphate isomerase/epimerase family protein [Trujillonella humicola]|uniref:sugar phosphate isomerase/epimerase family protein n=1 Tax=Trujillonella humicola TaxID=3383699 RepID=UPI0039067A72